MKMKKEVIKTIPAVKARPAKKTIKIITYCDFCHTQTTDSYGNERSCMCCGRDICRTHQTYDPNEMGDYGGHYCPICIKLLKEKYQPLFNELSDKHYQEEEDLTSIMKTESLNE